MDENKEIARLLNEKINLERKLKEVNNKVEPFVDEMKAFCKEKRLRRFTWGDFEMVYSPPKQYFKLLIKTEELHKIHPELTEEKIGYERLRITEIGE